MDSSASRWRNPMLWLVVGLPAASVVAGIGLVVVASRHSGDNSIDRVRRTAQIQVADLGPDATAQQGRFSAVLRADGATLEVLPVTGAFDRARPLQVKLLHPTESAQDRDVLLQPTETGWRLPVEVDLSHDWNVQLAPADGRWRILGRLPKGQQAVLLRPALQEPS